MTYRLKANSGKKKLLTKTICKNTDMTILILEKIGLKTRI